MAGKIIADTIEASGSQISLNVGNVTVLTASSTGLATANITTATFSAGSVGTPSITTSGDTNTGIFFSAADTIDFAEGGTATGQFDSSGNFKFNSGFGSVATAYGCRAWVNFNGTGTVAIRGSGNVTSITDNGTGDYTVNFTTAMPDTNYSVSAWNNNPMGTLGSGTSLRCGGMQYEVSRTTSAFRNVTFAYVGSTNTGTAEDINAIYVSIFR